MDIGKNKVALCLSGFIGNVDKWIKGQEIDYHYGYEKYIHPSILSHGNIDVFIHSWSVPHESGIKELYKPTRSVFEPNKDFKLRGHIGKERLPVPYAYCLKSMWYSRQKAVELVRQHEKENNFKYDQVILTRFDVALLKKFQFDEYDTSKLYIAGPIIGRTLPDGRQIPYRINDIYFMGNTENLSKVTKVYDTYEDVAMSMNKAWPLEHVSSHEVITNHFINESLFEKTECLFERPWGPSKTWAGDIRFLRGDPNLKTLPRINEASE